MRILFRHPHSSNSTDPPNTLSESEPSVKQTLLPPQPHRWFKRFPWILLGLGISTLVLVALRPSPIPVELGAIERGPLRVTVDTEGKTRVKNQFIVAAPVTGRLARIKLDVGDTVQVGDLVATIDPLPLTTQVKTAQAKLEELKAQLAGVETQRPKLASLSLAQANIRSTAAAKHEVEAKIEEAKASLAQAKRDRDRAQKLAADGVMTRQQHETAELLVIQHQQALEALHRQRDKAIADIASAQEALAVVKAERQDPDYLLKVYTAQLNAVEAELANLASEVRRTQIYAPVSGKVLRIEQESARFVQAGMPLLEIGNARDLELVIDVLSSDAVKIKPGNPIIIEQWGGDTPLSGQVKYIEPAAFTKISALGVDEQRVNVVGAIHSEDVSLGSNYRIEARISVWEGQNVLKVPVSALFRCEEDWCVFVERMGKAQKQTISIGQKNESMASVRQGLTLEDKVILHPPEAIRSGIKIKARE